MKIIVLLILTAALLVSSGCAVIDFLDGKHYNHTPNYDRSQNGSGYNTGGGGHSH